ncbi:hypothetical protein chiPu_0025956, partial [Chiloscyllium punctatum]|nr:hypothetical protein [Chiloscyllium punctatum]
MNRCSRRWKVMCSNAAVAQAFLLARTGTWPAAVAPETTPRLPRRGVLSEDRPRSLPIFPVPAGPSPHTLVHSEGDEQVMGHGAEVNFVQ